MADDDQPDWPPTGSAWGLPEGARQRGSTGQLWQVRDGQWVRIVTPKSVTTSMKATEREG